jgi:hypothetical protein
MAVLTFVSARIPMDRHDGVTRAYSEAVAEGLPAEIRETFLVADGETMAIATVWHSRQDLDAMLASGAEPLARRLLREAGGDPEARFFDIHAEASSEPRRAG